MTHEELYKQNGVELESASLGSKFFTGTPQHYGEFTDNNPYYLQMKSNPNMPRQDIDALYERAVQWQADYYNTLESREYNSPAAVVQRNREAGINVDIPSANVLSGSTSSGGSSSSVPSTPAHTRFSNVYDTASTIFQGVQTACDLVSTIASFGTASIDAFEKVKSMPSRISLSNSQAYVADLTKDDIVETRKLSNVHERLSLVNQLSSFFTPDSTAEDYVNILGTLGFSSDEIPNFERAIRDYHANPAYRAYYQDNVKRYNDLSAYNAVYTTDVQNDLYEGTLFIQRSDVNLAKLNGQIQTSMSAYLASNGYGEQVASNMVSSEQLQGKELEFSRSKLDRDIKVFADSLESIKNEIFRIDARISAIKGNAQNEHRFISSTEQLEIDTLSNLRAQMLTLGSSNLDSFFSLVDNANAIMYQNAVLLGSDGNPLIDAVSPRWVRTLDITFGNYVKGEGIDLSTLLSALIPNVGVRVAKSSSVVSRNLMK